MQISIHFASIHQSLSIILPRGCPFYQQPSFSIAQPPTFFAEQAFLNKSPLIF